MFGKYQAIFRSRWRAVIWSMGVLLTAYCTVPAPEGGASGEDQIVAVADMVGADVGQHGEAKKHVNPWALPADQQH